MAKGTRELNLRSENDKVEKMEFEPIQGYPMLYWRGKRPYKSTRYYPAQLKEVYGQPTKGPDGKPWFNRIYWGDNREVMSHLLREFRGKVDLVYIDPPFDSKAVYIKNINIKGKTLTSDHSAFEEKQYTDIWTNDEYLQFMYERLILIRELLSDTGSIYVHCDYHKSAYLRCTIDEIFGADNFVNEIIWRRKQAQAWASSQFGITTDTLLYYSKGKEKAFNPIYSKDDENTQRYITERFVYDDGDGKKYMKSPLVNPMDRPNLRYKFHGINPPKTGWLYSYERMEELYSNGELVLPDNPNARIYRKIFADDYKGQVIQNIWTDIPIVNPMAKERIDYPTQKPEALLERIVTVSTNPGDIVFDSFMGSGTTQAVAMKLGRRFIGADINLGAIHTTVKRLNKIIEEGSGDKKLINDEPTQYLGFQVYHVNNYEIFKNPIEAKSLLVEALELDAYPAGHLYDGQKEGRQYKIMPVNHIATKADLNELITGFDQRQFDKRQKEFPNKPVEKITLVCMGHEPDLGAHLKSQIAYTLDVEVVDILRDRQDLEFKRDSVAKVKVKKGELVIERFYPQNLLQKLSLPEKDIDDWRQLVETIAIDWNYTGEVMTPAVFDNPGKNELVQGRYKIPGDAGRIRLKIIDLISESLEMDVDNG